MSGRANRRPRRSRAVEAPRTSSALVGVLAVVGVLVLAGSVGFVAPAALALVAGGVLGVGSWLADLDRPLGVAAASVTTVVGTLLTAGSFGLTAVTAGSAGPGAGLLAIAALFAGLGAVATGLGSLGDGRWIRTLSLAAFAVFGPFVLVVGSFLQRQGSFGAAAATAVDVVDSLLDMLLVPGRPDLAGLLALVALASFAIALSLAVLPIASLFSKDRRAEVRETLDRTRGRAIAVGVVSLVLGTVLFPLPPSLIRSFAGGAVTLLDPFAGSSLVRTGLFGVAVVGGGVAAVVRTIRWVARNDLVRLARRVGTTAAGGVPLVFVSFIAADPVLRNFRAVGTPVSDLANAGADALGTAAFVLAVLVGVVVATATALTTVTTVSALGIVPNRTAAPSVASFGLIVGAIGIAIWSPPTHPVLAFVGVFLSVAVWDVGNYGVDVTAELSGVTARRVELVHAMATMAVGAGLLVVAVGLLEARAVVESAVSDSPVVVVAFAAAVLGTVLVMSTLRG